MVQREDAALAWRQSGFDSPTFRSAAGGLCLRRFCKTSVVGIACNCKHNPANAGLDGETEIMPGF